MDATPRRRHPLAFPPLPRYHLALAGPSSPPAGATRAGQGARGSAPASRAEAPPRETKSPPALPEAPPSSPGRKPKEGDRASVSARTGGAGRPRSAAGPAPPAAARRSPARAARRTRAVATRAGIPTASLSAGFLRAVSSQERRGGTRAPAVSTVVSARGRASTPRRTTHMAPQTCRAGSEGTGAEARSRTGVFRRHRKLAYL